MNITDPYFHVVLLRLQSLYGVPDSGVKEENLMVLLILKVAHTSFSFQCVTLLVRYVLYSDFKFYEIVDLSRGPQFPRTWWMVAPR